jgi:hypothetical protein
MGEAIPIPVHRAGVLRLAGLSEFETNFCKK